MALRQTLVLCAEPHHRESNVVAHDRAEGALGTTPSIGEARALLVHLKLNRMLGACPDAQLVVTPGGRSVDRPYGLQQKRRPARILDRLHNLLACESHLAIDSGDDIALGKLARATNGAARRDGIHGRHAIVVAQIQAELRSSIVYDAALQ